MELVNPPGIRHCSRCGYPNDERAFFCSNCGILIGSKAGRNYYFDGLPLISLLVTIAGFFMAGFIGPLIGVILGHISLRRLNRLGVDNNRGLAVTSLVIGYFLLAIGLLILIMLGVFVGAALFRHGGANGHWNYL
jgi:hypothetical protein